MQDSKHQKDLVLEVIIGKHQLRLAALDRRLQVHQEAFGLWRKLVSNVHGEEIGDVVIECQDWWNNNCLYLEPEAREAFNNAYRCAHNHRSFLQDRTNPDLVKKNWKDITGAGEVIVKRAELPTLGALESEVLEDVDSNLV